jgi:tripartite-type tricarboxylate transporter receptor subunit TctC
MARLKRLKRALIAMAALAVVVRPSSASAQNFPAAPVKVISDSAPGSAPDVILRIVAENLTKLWGQQIVVLNQPGAGGSRAASAASSAPPDGYTLYLAVSAAFVTMKGSSPNIPIRMPNDFTAVALVSEQPLVIAVAPSLGIKNLQALIDLARQKPGELNYAVSGRGRQSHLTGELLQRRAGIKLQMVPYSSGGPTQAISDLASGRVHIIIEGAGALVGAMQGGLIQGVSVGSDGRLAEFPQLSAISETVPGFKAAGWLAMLAPNGTKPDIVRQISGDLHTVLTQPEVKAKLSNLGGYPRPLSPEDTLAYIKAEEQTWGPILEELAKPQ